MRDGLSNALTCLRLLQVDGPIFGLLGPACVYVVDGPHAFGHQAMVYLENLETGKRPVDFDSGPADLAPGLDQAGGHFRMRKDREERRLCRDSSPVMAPVPA